VEVRQAAGQSIADLNRNCSASLVEVRQAAGQSIADLNRNCSADGIHRPQRFGVRLIAWQEITMKASYGT